MNPCVYSIHEENWNIFFESIEKAIIHLIDEGVITDDGQPKSLIIYKGDLKDSSSEDFIDPEDIISNMQNLAVEKCGEVADDYLNYVSEEQTANLKKIITDWIHSNNLYPSWYNIKNIEQITIKNIYDHL